MDRIRKALDLARQEREHAFSQPQDSRAFAPEPVAAAPIATESIRYVKTPSFQPAAQRLESERILAPGIIGTSTEHAASAFRMLRTQVLLRLDENDWRALAVLSPGSRDGKTTTAINLAIAIANDKRHTALLVDFDLRQPSIARKFGLQPKAGTDDLLAGNARVEECMVRPEGYERLLLLPARSTLPNSSEALSGPRCRELIAELRARYAERVLIFDLPPVLGADDALAFAPLVECALMVVAEGYTPREELVRSMELLRKTPIVGTVLNRATDVVSGYG